MESDKFVVGIDVGTTSIKFTLMTLQQDVLVDKKMNCSYEVPREDWCEIDPEKWFHLIMDGLHELDKQYSLKDALVGLGITGQMHTSVFLDEQGNSIRPAILWKDKRTIDTVSQLTKKFSKEEIRKFFPHGLSTGNPLVNLIWIKENEQWNYGRVKTLFTTINYVVYKLTGQRIWDYCSASTSSLYDFKKNNLSSEIIKKLDINSDFFPPIKYASEIAGTLNKDIKDRFNINHSVPVIVGTGDNVASTIANNGFEKECPIISLGTSGMIIIPNNCERYNKIGKNVKAGLYLNDRFMISQGSVQSGAKANEWWVKSILGQKDYQKLQGMVDRSTLGDNQIVFSPHLSGEKTLFNNPKLKAGFYGLDLNATSSDMYLSVLEGVGFGLKMLHERLNGDRKPDSIVVLGGGSKSDLWMEILANIFNISMLRSKGYNEAVHGIARLTLNSLFYNFNHPFKANYEVFTPNITAAKKYEEKYLNYTKYVAMTRQL